MDIEPFPLNMGESEAASAADAAPLYGQMKRGLEDWPDMAAGCGVKRVRLVEDLNEAGRHDAPSAVADAPESMNPYPYFGYSDRSNEEDPDPLLPLTLPGRVPNFPAKMHSILSREDLKDIICWMPHGRAWRVLKPREFEVRVLPTYFEHAKFSSFIRQANGWGFRRITQGRDRNAYYHEMFLKGVPHLCKTMKRPGVSKKKASDPDHEPDLYKISELHPLPEKAGTTSHVHDCTLQGGPKARMPIYSGTFLSKSKPSEAPLASLPRLAPYKNSSHNLTPHDQHAVSSFEESLGLAENGGASTGWNDQQGTSQFQIPSSSFIPPASMPVGFPFHFGAPEAEKQSQASTGNAMGFPNPTLAAAFQASQAATQFAAGFAAAAALSQHQFKSLMDSFATMQTNGTSESSSPVPMSEG